MSDLARTTVSLAAVLAIVGAWASASATRRPDVLASASCDISGKERQLGPTYVTSLRVKGVSCSTGVRVVRRYYKCRLKTGGRRGRCHRRVVGFSCHEKRLEAIKTEFDARVTCKRGRSRVWHNYTQFT
jgi:hypothetical protein